MPVEARAAIEDVASKVRAPLSIAGQDWDVYIQHGDWCFQDQDGLLGSATSRAPGSHQIGNAGNAIAVIRALKDRRITDQHIADGLTSVSWPARMQRLSRVALCRPCWMRAQNSGLMAGTMLTQVWCWPDTLKALPKKPLVIIWGLLKHQGRHAVFRPLAELADHVITLSIPNEVNAIPAETLAETVKRLGTPSSTAASVEDAVAKAAAFNGARVLICGSLYLAGHVLAAEREEQKCLP